LNPSVQLRETVPGSSWSVTIFTTRTSSDTQNCLMEDLGGR
jgi:hypothetical protein